MKTLPKVEFKLPSIAQEARTLQYFCSPRPTGWDWSMAIYNRHPELEGMLSGIVDKEKMYKQCHIYAKQYRKEN